MTAGEAASPPRSQRQSEPVNIIGLTQSSNVDVFLNLLTLLREQRPGALGRVGGYVSMAQHFRSSDTVARAGDGVEFLKEWEIVEAARRREPDRAWLAERESQLEPAAVWKAIIGDRRLIYGRTSKQFQDTRVHFSDRSLYAICEEFIRRFDAFLDAVRPDVVLGFTAVTFGELLGLEIARSRGIPTLQLHSSRISNFFAYHDTLLGTSDHIRRRMAAPDRLPQSALDQARTILDDVRRRGVMYEGVNLRLKKGRPFRPRTALRRLPGAVRYELLKARDPVLRRDHHDPGLLRPWYFEHVRQPLRAAAVSRFLARSGRVVPLDRLEERAPFAFFPLHSEPEVALQVLGRPYHKNQVELIRNLACSLPAGMSLVVKEHPRSFGLRPVEVYETLLEVPNLYFSEFDAPPLEITRHASLVCVISGTIGLEAALIGKPVIMFGRPKFEALPRTIVAPCTDLFALPELVRGLLDDYHVSDDALVTFLASVIDGSTDIDVYSVLLAKPDRYSSGREHISAEEKRRQDYEKLGAYTWQRIDEELALRVPQPTLEAVSRKRTVTA